MFFSFKAFYYVFNIGIVSLSVASSVYVLNLHFRGHKYSPVPDWIKKILFIKTTEDIGINLIKIKNFKKGFRSTALNKPSTLSLKALEGYYHLKNRKKSFAKGKVFNESDLNKKNNYNHVPNDLNDKILSLNNNNLSNKTDTKFKNLSDASMNQLNDQHLINKNIEKILKITKLSAELFERNYIKTVFKQIISDEWKYVAARFDFFLFIFALFIVIGTPILLFGKYAKRDFYKDLKCGCDV
jgi:hypothetical protein